MVRSPLRGALSASQSVEVKPDTAEVVFLGEILGATGFKDTCVHGGVMCRWQVVHGEHWNLERGERGGATQASEPSAHGGELAAWSHPLQMQFSTTSVQGWPKLVFAVYERDGWAQTDAFAAYGVCNLPLTPGFHDVEAHCWRANNRNARMSEEIAALFAGARAELDGWKRCVIRREELYASPAVTVGMGSVHLQVNVLAKNLDISGLHVGGVSASAAADKARRAALRARAGLAASPGGKENDPTDSPMSSPRNWPGSPEQASGVASVRRAVGGEGSGGEPSLPSSHRRAGRFSAPGGAGVTPDSTAPRRSFRSSVSAVSAATDAFGGAGGRRARGGGGLGGASGYGGGVASSALSERRAERTSSGASGYGPPVGGGVGASGYGGGGVGAFAHQREQIEDEPLNQPGGRRSRAFARGGGY